MIASEAPELQNEFLKSLKPEAVRGLPYLWEFWALPHQLPPEDADWRTWVILGGRGAGKTRAGAEWVRTQVEGNGPLDPGPCHRVALIGETYDQARNVMVFGQSGIMACTPPDRKPVWEATKRRLTWQNGATAEVFSASDFEALRGPQFDAAWVDELAKWVRAEDAWEQLQFALRLGDCPRKVVTTTPRDRAILKEILAAETTRISHAPTEANRANLAQSFLEEVRSRYDGTRTGRQELDGVLVEDIDGALWRSATIEATRISNAPTCDRIVVAVDPPVTGHSDSDACGIVVAGVTCSGPPQDWQAVVLEDCSVTAATPTQWATAAVAAFERHGADRIVAEVNQGGDLVETVVRQIDPLVPFTGVRASRGKVARAEPVAALYEQGRVSHVRGLAALEDEMCAMTTSGYRGRGSPDRVDALVWALTELMIVPAARWTRPRVRTLG